MHYYQWNDERWYTREEKYARLSNWCRCLSVFDFTRIGGFHNSKRDRAICQPGNVGLKMRGLSSQNRKERVRTYPDTASTPCKAHNRRTNPKLKFTINPPILIARYTQKRRKRSVLEDFSISNTNWKYPISILAVKNPIEIEKSDVKNDVVKKTKPKNTKPEGDRGNGISKTSFFFFREREKRFYGIRIQ